MSRDHGTRAKYVVEKCRCELCRESTREYERERKRRTVPAYVGADRARQHVRYLAENGIGLKQIAKVAPVSQGALWKLMYGKRLPNGTQQPSKRIKAETEAAILAVSIEDAADGSREPAGPTLANVETLLSRGWTKAEIARRIAGPGSDARALQLGSQEVTRANARAVRALLDEPAPAPSTSWAFHHLNEADLEDDQDETDRWANRAAADPYDLLRLPEGLDTTWRAKATCRRPEFPTRLFFPARGDTETIKKAREVCERCPVHVECRDYGTAIGATGIWGGTSEKQRKRPARAA